jgi:glucose/arabinose dehydrogenase
MVIIKHFALAVLFSLLLCSTVQAQRLEPFSSGFKKPVSITHAGDGSGRLFVIEQGGLIKVISGGKVNDHPFLDLRDVVSPSTGERGLFDLAFHPDYRTNGQLLVHYTDKQGNSVVARYHVSEDLQRADPDSGSIVLFQPQPWANHNGGEITFGPDGYLYIGLGDGGSVPGLGDSLDAAQNRAKLHGTILRIDIDTQDTYKIPKDNPFVGVSGARPEIWAYGLRNPWRFSFDRLTGDLYIGDVGRNKFEEIDFQPASSPGGENYGWDRMEAEICFPSDAECSTDGLTLPILSYPHSAETGFAVTGGYVYRGRRLPQLVGNYLFGDFVSGRIWVSSRQTGGAWRMSLLLETGLNISTFGEDERGELYLVDYREGTLYKLVP